MFSLSNKAIEKEMKRNQAIEKEMKYLWCNFFCISL